MSAPTFETIVPRRHHPLLALGMGRVMHKPTFESIVAEHGGGIHRRLRALRVPGNDVPDVAQEVLAAVYRGLPAFEPALAECPESAVSSWLSAICQHQASNYHRARRRRSERERLEADLDRELAEVVDNEQAYDACETRRILFELVGALCPERRHVLVAHEIEGMAMSAIAHAQGIPLNTAWNRLRLGREDLRADWRRGVR